MPYICVVLARLDPLCSIRNERLTIPGLTNSEEYVIAELLMVQYELPTGYVMLVLQQCFIAITLH